MGQISPPPQGPPPHPPPVNWRAFVQAVIFLVGIIGGVVGGEVYQMRRGEPTGGPGITRASYDALERRLDAAESALAVQESRLEQARQERAQARQEQAAEFAALHDQLVAISTALARLQAMQETALDNDDD